MAFYARIVTFRGECEMLTRDRKEAFRVKKMKLEYFASLKAL